MPYANWIPLPGGLFEWFSAVRWPIRSLLFALVFFAVLAGLGFTLLTRNLSPRRRAIDCAMVALLLFFEYRPLEPYSSASVWVPDPLAVSDAYPFLAIETDQGAIVELPAADLNCYRTPPLTWSAGARGTCEWWRLMSKRCQRRRWQYLRGRNACRSI